MAWVKIDETFYDHPKWADAPGDSIALWLAAMAWCNRNESHDGFIPVGKLAGLICVKNAKRTSDDLVARRAFDSAEGGFVIHDYAEYQQPEKVKRIREQRSENGKKGAQSRWQKPSGLPSQTARQTDGPYPLSVEDDETLSSDAAATVANALDLYADHLALGKENPIGYALAIVNNGDKHRAKLVKLLGERLEATADELYSAYKAGRWPVAASITHPSVCICDGTGRVLADPNDESRSAPVKPCPVTEWPDATVHQLRATS